MTEFTIALLPSAQFAAVILAFSLAAYFAGRLTKAHEARHEGRLSGMREERSHANARIIRAKMQSHHAGVIAERNRQSTDNRLNILAAGRVMNSRN